MYQDNDEMILDFDTAAVDPRSIDFSPIPAGVYPCAVRKVEIKPTKDGGGRRMSVELAVVDGEHSGRVIFAGLNIVNKSEVAQQIGRQQLAQLLEAAGMPGERDMSRLVGCEIAVKVKIVPPQNGYEPKNDVVSFAAMRAVPNQPAAPAAKKAPAFMR